MGIPAAMGVDASGLPPIGDQANGYIAGTFSAVGPGRSFAFWGPMNMVIYASYKSSLATTAGSNSATVTSAGAIIAGTAINSVNLPAGTTVGVISGTTITLAFPTVTLIGDVNISQARITGLRSTAGLLGATVTAPAATGMTFPSGTTVTAIATTAIPATNQYPGQHGTVLLSAAPTIVGNQKGPYPIDFALTNNSVTTGTDANATYTGAAVVYTGTVQLERSFDGAATWIVCNIGGSGTLAQYSAGTPVSTAFGEPERQVNYRLNCTAYTAIAGTTLNYRISTTGGAAISLAVNQLT